MHKTYESASKNKERNGIIRPIAKDLRINVMHNKSFHLTFFRCAPKCR